MRERYRDFREHILDNMIPPNVHQESKGTGKDIYTADDWTLEVCRGLMNGVWFSQEIKESVDYKRNTLYNLKKIKDDVDVLCVGEVGRGLDILTAKLVKEWKTIICYDQNDVYKEYLKRYFEDEIIFYGISTEGFVKDIEKYKKDKCVMIMNHTKFRKFDKLKDKFTHFIFNGELLW